MTLDIILEEIKKAKNVVVLTHEGPDGDAIGSSLAMAYAIKGLGKSCVDIYLKEYPYIYKFMPGIDMIKADIDKTN